MRSSPSCLAVNRKGLGVHFTVEKYGNYSLPTPPPGPVYQEAIKAATSASQSFPQKDKRVKLLVLAGLGVVNTLAVLVNSIFDFVDILNFP